MASRRRTTALTVKLFVIINLILVLVTAAGLGLDVLRQYRSYHRLMYENLTDDAHFWRVVWVQTRSARQPERFQSLASLLRGPGAGGESAQRFLVIAEPAGGDPAWRSVQAVPESMDPAMRDYMLAHAAEAHVMDSVGGHEVMLISLPVGARDNRAPAASAAQRVIIAEYVDQLDSFITKEIISRLGFAAIAVLWLMVIINLLLARWITRPVKGLSEAAGRLGREQYDQKIPTDWGTRELNGLADSFEQARVRLNRAEQNRRADLARARRTQQALLPALDVQPPGVAVAACYSPAQHVGGDLYDYMVGPDGRVMTMVGDASGHGVAAAMMMTLVKIDLEHLIDRGAWPGGLAALADGLNNDLLSVSELSDFVSLFVLQVNPVSGVGRYLNAGHPPALRVRADGSIERLGATGPLIGVQPDAWAEQPLQLAPGERVVLMTDGLLDVENEAGEPFGSARMDELLRRARSRSPDELVELFKAELADWIGDGAADDDITLLVLDYKGRGQVQS